MPGLDIVHPSIRLRRGIRPICRETGFTGGRTAHTPPIHMSSYQHQHGVRHCNAWLDIIHPSILLRRGIQPICRDTGFAGGCTAHMWDIILGHTACRGIRPTGAYSPPGHTTHRGIRPTGGYGLPGHTAYWGIRPTGHTAHLDMCEGSGPRDISNRSPFRYMHGQGCWETWSPAVIWPVAVSA